MDISSFSVIVAFVAGIISFLSPCVLPLVPGYVSYIAGGSLKELSDKPTSNRRLQAIYLSLCFVAGFSMIFVALGASASSVGEFLLLNKRLFEYIAGALIVVFGLYLTGIFRIPFLERDIRFVTKRSGGSSLGAVVLGAAFAFGWTPCIGPVLGGILTLSASSTKVGEGVLLLGVYSLGLGAPFVLAAAFTGKFLTYMKNMRRVGRLFQFFAGLVMSLTGVALITGHFSTVAFWLLEIAPALVTLEEFLM